MSGESAYSIARSFNTEGIQPPAARTWSSTMVTKMLRNPRYAGNGRNLAGRTCPTPPNSGPRRTCVRAHSNS
ncbi:recombinase family protein [Streptomyces lydicus]|uniref:recombinase family protein n=1 Tax=Streptomyces lydicus TaxID=47763 RepID=UPI0037D63C05